LQSYSYTKRMNSLKIISSLRDGDVSLIDLIKNRIVAAQESTELGAYTHVGSEVALESAKKRLENSAAQRGALHGLPLIVKDNIDVAGMPTTAGSHALGNHYPAVNSPVIQRLCDAGAVIMGKANLHEFSLGITTNNGAFGPARNPYSLQHIPGGSSGGTAAAVAARLVPAGIGSDTGGSLRIPAAMCGVVGFRPTTGRWPSQGVVTISNTRDTVGPIATTVADCALLDAVVCGGEAKIQPAQLKGLRVGVPRFGFWQNLEPSVEAAGTAFLQTLKAAGVELIEVDVGIDFDACTNAGMVIALLELFPNIEGYLKQHGKAFRAAAIVDGVASPDVKGIMASLLGPDAPPFAAYQHALKVDRPHFQKLYADCFAKHAIEALIFPTTPLPAARIGEDETVVLNGQTVPTFLTFTRNVGPGSLVGLPGISMPIGCNKDGLPLSIALDAPSMQDKRLLEIASAIEQLLPPMPLPKFINSGDIS
jgi:indoleacetamide hydrolase